MTVTSAAGTNGLMWWILRFVTRPLDRRSWLGSRQFNNDLKEFYKEAHAAGIPPQEAYELAWKHVVLKWGVSDLDALPTTADEPPPRPRKRKGGVTTTPNGGPEDRPP